jgi:hypothetical protein
MLPTVLADYQHLPEVALRLGMTLETVLVSTLLLADLTEPSEPLKPLGFHRIGEVFWRSNFGAFTLNRFRERVSE